jgi:DNA invertase Pin-like site-specific DNA recombinase
VAYSYVRFSHPDQAKGDSLRRQTQAAAAWCERNGVRLDGSTTLHDLGRSAYTGKHRTNPDRHALAAFLKLVEAGKVPRGSYLIIENLDRLSREHIQPALLLALNLLQAGVRIVQLKPAEMVFDDHSDTLPVMMMMMELSRGHGESSIKSERNGAAWAERRRKAREQGEVLTRRLPAWVEERGGKLRLVEGRAAAVRRVFALAAAGYGTAGIVKKLTQEKVPPFGASGHWARTYVALILKDRRAVGELQPRRGDGAPDGDPIPGYFPAVVTEGEWQAARAGSAQRRRKPGRLGTHVNVFAGLLRDARDGDTYYCSTRSSSAYGTRWRVLLNTASADGRAPARSFPFETFERAVLSMLREVDPREVLGEDDGPDEAMVLAGRLAGVEGKIAELEAELLQGDVAALAKVLRQLEAQKRDLAQQLAEARQRAAHPLGAAWGEARSLIDALDGAPDPADARLRLRAALRRIVDSVWLLPVARGRDRLCAVQVWFAGGERHLDYLILSRPPKADGRRAAKGGGWWARSLASVAGPGDLDLRDRGQAEALARDLAAVDLAALGGA